ncbi:hypothetical protein BC830DRAFT_1080320 [Chytriomyces sp. MP71]|nr:hypothetical protein BC830DRAFT_1080320 [Chytriomyces sp. MP71]
MLPTNLAPSSPPVPRSTLYQAQARWISPAPAWWRGEGQAEGATKHQRMADGASRDTNMELGSRFADKQNKLLNPSVSCVLLPKVERSDRRSKESRPDEDGHQRSRRDEDSPTAVATKTDR